MQMLFAVCTASRYLSYVHDVNGQRFKKFCKYDFLFAVIATIALAFLLLPMCQYLIRPCSDGNKWDLYDSLVYFCVYDHLD